MPNTLTSIFVSNPATEPVEAPHPNTGVYVTGTQAVAGGPWSVVHTLVTKTTTPLTMVGRLKNFPSVTVSVVASGGPNGNGNIFNNILAAPTGTAATATSSTALNVVVSSIANSGGYRLLASDTQAGTYTQIYQSTAASYPHTGLTASQTKWYKWQYVGNGGFYDDSLLSTAFSGVTSVGSTTAVPANADYTLTTFNKIEASGITIRNPHWNLPFTTTSDVLQIGQISELSNTVPFQAMCGVGLWVNGAFVNVFPVPPSSGITEYVTPAITLPGTTGSLRTCYLSGPYVDGQFGFSGNFMGVTPTKIIGAAAVTFTRPAPLPSAHILIGDSLTSGNLPDVLHTQAMVPLLRADSAVNGRDIIAISWGNNSAQNGLAACMVQAKAALTGRTGTLSVTLRLGTNDLIQLGGPDISGVIGAAIDDLHTFNPAIQINVMTLSRLPSADTTKYAAYLAAYKNLLTGRTWLKVYDGSSLPSSAGLKADNIHWNTSGNSDEYTLERGIILGTATAVPAPAVVNVPAANTLAAIEETTSILVFSAATTTLAQTGASGGSIKSTVVAGANYQLQSVYGPSVTINSIQADGAGVVVTALPPTGPAIVIGYFNQFATPAGTAPIANTFLLPDTATKYTVQAQRGNATTVHKLWFDAGSVYTGAALAAVGPYAAILPINGTAAGQFALGGGGWTSTPLTNSYSGTVYYTSTAAAYFEFPHNGAGGFYIGNVLAGFGGPCDVLVDGVKVGAFTTLGADSSPINYWRFSPTTAGAHVIRVRRTDPNATFVLMTDFAGVN